MIKGELRFVFRQPHTTDMVFVPMGSGRGEREKKYEGSRRSEL